MPTSPLPVFCVIMLSSVTEIIFLQLLRSAALVQPRMDFLISPVTSLNGSQTIMEAEVLILEWFEVETGIPMSRRRFHFIIEIQYR